MTVLSQVTLTCLMLVSATGTAFSLNGFSCHSVIDGLDSTWRVGGASECHFDCKSTNCHHEESICYISVICLADEEFIPKIAFEASCQAAPKTYTCNLKTMDVKGAVCKKTGATNTEDCGMLPHTHNHNHGVNDPPHGPAYDAQNNHTHQHEHQSKHCSIVEVWDRTHPTNAHTFPNVKVADTGSNWCGNSNTDDKPDDPIGGANHVPCN